MTARGIATRIRRCFVARRPGQGTVEYAACLFLLTPLLFGGIDLGRAFFWHAELGNAANEGARVASFDNNTSNITNAAISKSGSFASSGSMTVTITCYQGATSSTRACPTVVNGDSINVQASATFTPITPLIAGIVGNTMAIGVNAKRTYQV